MKLSATSAFSEKEVTPTGHHRFGQEKGRQVQNPLAQDNTLMQKLFGRGIACPLWLC